MSVVDMKESEHKMCNDSVCAKPTLKQFAYVLMAFLELVDVSYKYRCDTPFEMIHVPLKGLSGKKALKIISMCRNAELNFEVYESGIDIACHNDAI